MTNPIQKYLDEHPEISAHKLSQICGLSRNAAYKHAKGEQGMDRASALAYHKHLGIPLEDLLMWNPKYQDQAA